MSAATQPKLAPAFLPAHQPGYRIPRPLPDDPAAEIYTAALRYHLAGRIDAAIPLYERTLALKPGFADACNNLGVALAAQGRNEEALRRYSQAILLKPDYADAWSNLGLAMAGLNRLGGAIGYYRRALAIDPCHTGAHYNLANALAAQSKIDEAIHHFKRALALQPDHADAHNDLANALAMRGDFERATAHYERALAIAPNHIRAHFNRAEIRTFGGGDPALAALEALARRSDVPPGQQPMVHFALAKALEDTGDYARAFEHLRTGNTIKRKQISWDEAAVARLFARIPEVFDRPLLERFAGQGYASPAPIFVLGMPRSGSTLIEQILASHPQVHGAGELPDLQLAAAAVLNTGDRRLEFPEYGPALDAHTLKRIGEDYCERLQTRTAGSRARVVDKLPENFLRIGLIRLALPNARIIHTVRNPIDTCVSCYSRLFAGGQHFTYDLAELGRYHRRYSALMDHWRAVLPQDAILDVAYEDVVDDLEGQARRLLDYCGLPWDDRCLSFHTTRRAVKTASAAQVRQPLFRRSLQRWRRFEAGLGPLLVALEGER
jgi:tetratricopeptide (TPR) repeat protein